ncbi:acyl-CoA dehydratase activase [Myxococcota bacterium]
MDQALLGIDVGSTNVKLCCLNGDGEEQRGVLAHEGDLETAVSRLCEELGINGQEDHFRGVATGAEGRHRLRLPEVIAPVAIERALAALGLHPRAVVSMGGEDLVVYGLDSYGRIVSTYAGNKCASGTGEFFRQQLGRMDLTLADLTRLAEGATVHRLSARCSVFMKSDCTHRLNKGEATKGDIALSLSKVMADKASEFLTKAKIEDGQVVLIGGVTQNRHLVRFIEEAWPQIELVAPKQAPYFEAFGAAHLAATCGGSLPEERGLVAGGNEIVFETFASLDEVRDEVRYVGSMRSAFDPDAEYILGVDGGSTTTKVALVNRETLEIVAEHYGRTHGDPVAAVTECLREVDRQLEGARPRIVLTATTGSSRELLGVFLETKAVYNEIIAHTVGTTYFESDVDTIFEIGGQDAKYVLINNGVPIDYAMNEACSAGTGSFLEESAAGDLNIQTASEIGPIALRAQTPLKFGEHCSAFINSDIRKAISQGARQEDIVAGLVFSIVANYLNRVVGNRAIGEHIVLQGGVAKNRAVPLAFARMTGKPIVVPPDPELMGCFGVARMAKQKVEEGLLEEGTWDLGTLIDKEIVYKSSFVCKACENHCGIRRLEVGGHRYPFGGRCSLYTNMRKKRRVSDDTVQDHTAVRAQMMFDEYAPDPEMLVERTDEVVGVPLALSVHTLWPFYAWYFHTLGVRTALSEKVSPQGIARQESNYCFPVEIAHGAVQDTLEKGFDYLFLPHFRDMPSMEADPVHACVCPLTQGLPFFVRQAFDVGDERILRPLVSFKHGWDASRPAFVELAVRLGFTPNEGKRAYERGIHEYRRFLKAYHQRGKELLAEIRSNPDRVYIALLGRPYNAFTHDANMGIPRKITSQGVTVVPFDMIFDPDVEILPNNYWYFGQQNMKAVSRVKEIPNLYLTWISNFSCAPDSFLLHYVRWMMGQKPYLVLEIDSHTADAGLDTRVEAFLDIVESYRRHVTPAPDEPFERRYRIVAKKEFCDIVDSVTGERLDIRDPRVTLVWPSMGDLSAQAMQTASTKQGVRSVHLPLPDIRSTQLARTVASGKECIPSLLVLGAILEFFRQRPPNRPGEIYVVLVPSTLGPCRTGQYHVFYERLFEELGWENVVQLVSGSENSYREMGPTFTRDVWRGLVLADYFWDARLGVRLLARDVERGLEVFERAWQRVRHALGVSPGALEAALERATGDLAAIPKWRTLEDVKKVLIVGEIYVRRDDFSVQEICDFLIEKGIYPKVAGVTEWFHYTDYARHFLMKDRRKRDGLIRWLREGGLLEEAWFYVEEIWKGSVEHKIQSQLVSTGLFPEVPHEMDRIISEGRRLFVEPDLESEATVSPAVGAAAMKEDYSGVAIIAPFGCLIGRLVEGVYAPWSKARGYPVIALENDGQPYPPNIISRMEIFTHNVLRFEPGREGLVSPTFSDTAFAPGGWQGTGSRVGVSCQEPSPDACARCSLQGEPARKRT